MPFRLGDKDRERFKLPEWIDYSPYAITLADIQFLSERFDFDPTDWPEPYIGQITLEQAGDPDAKAKPPRWRNWAWGWMLLRQNGIDASWDDAGQLAFHQIQFKRPDDEPSDVEPGKDVSPPSTASRRSVSSTTRRSSTSTASTKRKSTS